MDRNWSRSRKHQHLLNLMEWRETSLEASKLLKNRVHFCQNLVERLGLEAELDGHGGCVNCLEWSPNGLHLASGSDDTNVILWDPFRHKHLQVVPTPHMGNIFSVKFIANESVIATAAGDCRVIVQSVEGAVNKAVPLLDCACHMGRVKRLATAPDQPNLFWSAGEDGLVLQFDMREPHECPTQNKALLDFSFRSELKCIAVNPTRSHLIAIGANDCYVRLYDRRMLKASPMNTMNALNTPKRNEPMEVMRECVQYYAAGHLAKENAGIVSPKLSVTYVAFNSAGSEMLANVGGEQIYLFDINKSRHINELRVPQCTRRQPTETYENCCHVGMSNELHDARKNCACKYMKRAIKTFRRNWMSDVYSAARDYLFIVDHWPEHRQAYIGLIKCLITLKWEEEAHLWYKYFIKVHPESESTPMVKTLFESMKALKKGAEPTDNPTAKVDDAERDIRLESCDYEKRYLGHCNTNTDIKEANFLGEDGDFICAGSDEGLIFIWNKENMEIVRALNADSSIVNCIQPHPGMCLVASSGIDSAVKIWSPMPDNKENPNVVKQLSSVIENNQRRMCLDPFESMLATMGFQGYHLHSNALEASVSVAEMPTCWTN